MIATVDIQLNAAHPELPLAEFSAFVNSPSQVRVTGVPSAIGNWRLTKLYASVAYPDNTLHTVELSPGGVAAGEVKNWLNPTTPLTATLPGSAAVGSNPKGFQILADGVDESGNIVTGYCLGVGPLTIMPRDGIIVIGNTRYYFHFLDTVPATPCTGDTCVIDGVLKWYNGTAWQPFASIPVVAPSTNPADEGKAADALATGTALANRYTKEEVDDAIDALAAYYITYTAAGAAFPTAAALLNATAYYSGGALRIPTRNDYAVVLADETHGGAEWRYIYAIPDGASAGQWEAQYPIETNDYTALSNKPQINGHELSGNQTADDLGLAATADATLTPVQAPGRYTDWTLSPSTLNGLAVTLEYDSICWAPYCEALGGFIGRAKGDLDSTSLTWADGEWAGLVTLTATRTYVGGEVVGYTLGDQTDKPLQPQGDYQPALSTQQLANIAAVPNKADASRCQYPFNTATVSPEMPPIVTDVLDHAKNVVTLTSSEGTTIFLPDASGGYTRDLFISLTITASTPPPLSFIDKVNATSADIIFGEEQLADIDTGRNLILFTEVEEGKWKVAVEHEDFAEVTP